MAEKITIALLINHRKTKKADTPIHPPRSTVWDITPKIHKASNTPISPPIRDSTHAKIGLFSIFSVVTQIPAGLILIESDKKLLG